MRRAYFDGEKSKIVERFVHKDEGRVNLADDDFDGTQII